MKSVSHLFQIILLVLLVIGVSPISQFAFASEESSELSEIVVQSRSENDLRLKKDEINRVEVIRAESLRKKQAQTFAQALANEKGIDAQTSCAFCGAKRISINGFKGEHTTILVDGLPLHSTVSGFYGVEAIPLGGIDSIEIYRGSGASLTAPESIGGAVNIVTREVISSGADFDLSLANDSQRNASVLGMKSFASGGGLLIGAQAGEIQPLDRDSNRISEVPRQNTHSVFSKITLKPNETDEVSLRLSSASLRTIGGSMNRTILDRAVETTAVSDEFDRRDVRRRYLGDEQKITDNVSLDRLEAALAYRHQLESEAAIRLALGGAIQDQRAIYSHGYDYDNKDHLWVGLIEYQRTIGERHLLTVGLDSRNQTMDSDSQALYRDRSPPLAQDDLSHRSIGGFIQDTWLIDDQNELSAVLRVDSLRTNWSDLDKTIERTVLAPRLMYKHVHNSVYTSRASLGLGYRSPLTLFESQHGMSHDGFLLEIDELETAQSFVYSLAGQWHDDFFEVGAHITKISGMAYGVDQVEIDGPTIFRNSRDDYTISVFDFGYGRRIFEGWTVEGLVEVFDYPAGYKEKLPVAALEQRASVTSNLEWGRWNASQKIVFIGARDLAAYGYERHYNIAPSEDPLDPSFGLGGEDQKWQAAPAYFTVDLTLSAKIGESFSAGLAVLNLLDYTQVGAGDGPTTWDHHGDHFHLDNFHIWGPLRGRQVFLTLRGDFK